MKKVLYCGGAFLGLLIIHLLLTVLFLFLPVGAMAKAICLTVLLLMAGIALIVTEAFLTWGEQDGDLTDTDLGQIYLAKKTISSILGAAGANTFIYILNVVLALPTLLFGTFAIIFVLICMINAIIYLFTFRGNDSGEEEEEESEDLLEEES